MTTTPRHAVQALLDHPRLPDGDDERFTGYGVMGMPFATGHYLALRDMVATSIGPAYRALWHRDPAGHWTIHTTGAFESSCPRYFGSVTTNIRVPAIDVSWRDDHTLDVALGTTVTWRIELGSTPATRMMTTMGGVLPAFAWNSGAVLAAMEPMARHMLRSGRMRLQGATPNGHRFRSAPVKVWRVVGGAASFNGHDLGAPAPLDVQTRLGDFWLPQRGIFFIGRARFSPQVDSGQPLETVDRAARIRRPAGATMEK
ncbi:hypothetical protein N1027_11480 [Herbiconiux sp. CPCC 205763]|uniref:Acetoacetate decarboxylase n=1 Tax=Herbiconiux aconitum TaxID=2970913 RepID=A0ABT2GRB5_9MICO|nr:hypothetical protein [Herbiconiux aconitum]MCS5718754.1 hypothetical protein [Herbiconiux aconitum]